MKCYCASPFFNQKDIMVRDLMVEVFRNQYKNYNVLRPDLTKDSYNFDKNPSNYTAKELLARNLFDIDRADLLMFPKYTNDLGTLFEVGYAIKKSKKIIRFDYLTWNFENVLNSNNLKLNHGIIYLGNSSGAIILGYNYNNSKLGYYLPKGVNDNIMLAQFRRYVDAKDLGYNINKTLIEVEVEVTYGSTSSGEKCSRTLHSKYDGEIPRYVTSSSNLSNLDYLLCSNEFEDPVLVRLYNLNLDDILGKGQSMKKLYTGVS